MRPVLSASSRPVMMSFSMPPRGPSLCSWAALAGCNCMEVFYGPSSIMRCETTWSTPGPEQPNQTAQFAYCNVQCKYTLRKNLDINNAHENIVGANGACYRSITESEARFFSRPKSPRLEELGV